MAQEALFQFPPLPGDLQSTDLCYVSRDSLSPKEHNAPVSKYATYFRNAFFLTADKEVEIATGLTVAQIQALIDAQPKMLCDKTLTFTFKSGTHNIDSSLYFVGFCGGNLIIKGEPAIINTSVADIESFVVLSCSSDVLIDNFTFSSSVSYTATTNILNIKNVNSVNLENITATSANFNNFGRFSFFTCQGGVSTCTFNNMDRAIAIFDSSFIRVFNTNSFSSNTTDIVSSGAIGIYSGDILTDGYTYNKLAGGALRDQATGWL
ncbi:hypothetical protein AMJ80_06670 [bacterium SM23_31]|nr:MAG: hypothetical protein AMJ80_06670 [bacterium SM23_31]